MSLAEAAFRIQDAQDKVKAAKELDRKNQITREFKIN